MPLDGSTLQAIRDICGHLAQRTATLFLGAGVNVGTKDDSNNDFPLGQELSGWIARDLLDDAKLTLSLEEVAEIARFKVSSQVLNNYLFSAFGRFHPNTAHLALVQLPWDVIYTTNFDLLVEQAATSEVVAPAGAVKPVFSMTTDLTGFSEGDILYYKLHGSVDVANTDEGRLILTKDDYRHYEAHRKPLFARLERDLMNRAFLFVGYSLQDSNFRAILSDCLDQIRAASLPLSYALRRNFSAVEAVFWREKYNVELLNADATEFLVALRDTWEAEHYAVLPFEERKARTYAQVDVSARLPKVGDSFYVVSPPDCTGQSTPELFFRGAEPTWADIRDSIAPKRDDYWALMEGLFADLVEPSGGPTVYLVTGHAGTGKTTLIRTVAFDIAYEFEGAVLVHIPNAPLDARLLASVTIKENPKRLIVIIHHAADVIREIERFIETVRQLKLPVSVVLEERKNQWEVATSTVGRRLTAAEFDLARLSEREIDLILQALTRFNLLGKLKGTPLSYQRDHFLALAEKELLVALRELTSTSSFDAIVRDEFQQIPSTVAKRAYVYVASLGQINLALRYSNLIRILGLRYEQLGVDVLRPTDGVLISGEASGTSRHNAGFSLRARHPIIASIIFAVAAPDDRAKFEIVNNIITYLDPGYAEDRRLLEEIVRRKELVNTFASPENRRAIYDRLRDVLPGNPYVLQHRSILERDLGNADLALRYAREALAIDRGNPVLQNTLGLALELSARDTADSFRRKALRTEADKLFEEGLRRDPSDPFAYLGKVYLWSSPVSVDG